MKNIIQIGEHLRKPKRWTLFFLLSIWFDE